MRVLECGIMIRIYMMASSLFYGLTAFFGDETLVYRIAHTNAFALATMAGLVVLALLGLVDVIVNDILPDRFVIHGALRDRHLVSAGMALVYGVQMFTEARYGHPLSMLPFYMLHTIFIPLSAFADIKKRYTEPQGDCI